MEINEMLDQLSEMQAYKDKLTMDFEQAEVELLPLDLLRKLDDLHAERDQALDSARLGIDRLTAEIKAAVIEAGETIDGTHLKAVFTAGRESVDLKAFRGYAVAHPEAQALLKKGEPYVTIKSI